MTRTHAGIFSVIGGLALVAGAGDGWADGHRLEADPSGAPQCFTASGQRAPLASCHVAQADPSGAPMCFTLNGDKALLSRCQPPAPLTYAVRLDPSGAPMCFSSTGRKAPLAFCAPAIEQLPVLARAH